MASGRNSRVLSIVRGDDYTHVVSFVADGAPVDLSGSTFRAHLRRSPDDAMPAEEFACSTNDPEGEVVMTLTNEQTGAMVAGATYYWDLEQTRAGLVSTWLTGSSAVILKDVTRD